MGPAKGIPLPIQATLPALSGWLLHGFPLGRRLKACFYRALLFMKRNIDVSFWFVGGNSPHCM